MLFSRIIPTIRVGNKLLLVTSSVDLNCMSLPYITLLQYSNVCRIYIIKMNYISIVAGREGYESFLCGQVKCQWEPYRTKQTHRPATTATARATMRETVRENRTAWGFWCVRGQWAVGRGQKDRAGKRQNPIKYSTWQRCENYKAIATFCVCGTLSCFYSVSSTISLSVWHRLFMAQ